MDTLDAIKQTFFQECEELLTDAEQGLLAIKSGEADADTVNAVFRAVHSVKGGAGAFALEDLVRFAHVFESVMDELRSERMMASDEIAEILLRAADVLADHVQAARDGTSLNEARASDARNELQALLGEPADQGSDFDDGDFAFAPMMVDLGDADVSLTAEMMPPTWSIDFSPKSEMYLKANEAGLILREVARLGAVATTIDDSDLPPLDQLSAEQAYVHWNIRLTGQVTEAEIRQVFEFVEDDCKLAISLSDSQCVQPDVNFQPDDVDSSIPPVLEIMGVTPEQRSPTPTTVALATPLAPTAAQQNIRVELERVDRLINVIGELVIQQAMLSQKMLESGLTRSSNVTQGLEDLEALTREIQDSVMAIRAQPVRSVFQRMPRLAREVADITGKRVKLIMEGEGTEVDKTIIERLTDPITHMLRNAIDHGLEDPEGRAAAGKPPEGMVHLRALHRSGRIVIELEDDGQGINRTRVRKIAVDRGLIANDATLSDEDTDNLIFLPGFTTSEAVSDLSGRGVGMDVVRRSVQSLGGRISIASEPGIGSKFTMSLPLTLAVLDGMVVSAGDQTLIAPLANIVESFPPPASDIHYVGPNDAVVRVRDIFIPVIDLAVALGFRDEPLPTGSGVAVLVETESGSKAAFLVDAIQGQRQVVIKSIEANYQKVQGISSATILGDGRVALILDIDNLVANAKKRPDPQADMRWAS